MPGKKKTPGLIERGGTYHIRKMYKGRLLCESTGTSNHEEAVKYYHKRMSEWMAADKGERPRRTWREIASEYYNAAKPHQKDDLQYHLNMLDPWIGDLDITEVNSATLSDFVAYRLGKPTKKLVPAELPKQGRPVSHKTVNLSLGHVRRILNLAATTMKNEYDQTFLDYPPKITMLPLKGNQRAPRPITWDEQDRLLSELPPHLQVMVLFKVNTGTREQEVCRLRWEYEHPIKELGRSVFVVPEMDDKGRLIKNGEPRVVMLNDVAWSVIEGQRGKDTTWVFPYERRVGRRDKLPGKPSHPIGKINNSAWKKARDRAGLNIRVHDLKHTFGARLRAAKVGFEDRQVLLGHRSKNVTTHYSAADLRQLLDAANLACKRDSGPSLILVKGAVIR